MKWIGRVVGVFCIFYGLYNMSFSDIVQAGISLILISMGIAMITADSNSPNLKKFTYFSNFIALLIAIIILLKVYVIG